MVVDESLLVVVLNMMEFVLKLMCFAAQCVPALRRLPGEGVRLQRMQRLLPRAEAQAERQAAQKEPQLPDEVSLSPDLRLTTPIAAHSLRAAVLCPQQLADLSRDGSERLRVSLLCVVLGGGINNRTTCSIWRRSSRTWRRAPTR